MTNQNIGMEVIRTTMNKIWRINKAVTSTEVGKNPLVISFAIEADIYWVMDEQPWLFDNELMILKILQVSSQPLATFFETKNFLDPVS